ncbi:MAG: sugar transferase [Chitinophagales bacterium]|jgi:lipopolysaccharide/colanic/teichoic acid biosynthesis glycosyltransferase|nr:sugar transferase [Chitinophagales bacterium]
MKRIFDLFFTILGLIILLPFFALIAIWVMLDSRGGVFYRQERIGKDQKPFKLLKFRSMRTGADKQGLLTVGMKDSRITRSGYYLRKYKLDELPQLINVLLGDMSLVGPRPEVEKYVKLYSQEQLKVLSVRPGITDLASIKYRNENDVLASFEDAEAGYIQSVMPDKLKLNLMYIQNRSLLMDLRIILTTVLPISFV